MAKSWGCTMKVVTLVFGAAVAAATLGWIGYVLSWQHAMGHVSSNAQLLIDVIVYSCLMFMVALWVFTPIPPLLAILAATALLAPDVVVLSRGAQGTMPILLVSSHFLNAMVAATLAWIAARHIRRWRTEA